MVGLPEAIIGNFSRADEGFTDPSVYNTEKDQKGDRIFKIFSIFLKKFLLNCREALDLPFGLTGGNKLE